MDHRIRHSDTVWAADQPLLTALRDVSFLSSGAGPVLQAAGGPLPGFQITAWTLDGGLSLRDSILLPGTGQAGTEPVIETITMATGEQRPVFLGGGTETPVALLPDGTGGFDGSLAIEAAGPGDAGTLQALVSVTNGDAVFAAGLPAGHAPPALWRIGDDGRFDPIPTDPAILASDGLTGLIALGPYLVTAGTDEALLSAYHIGTGGELSPEDSLTTAENPGMAGAVVLASGQPGGIAHVVAGAAQSGTLSVWQITGDGTLRLTDHLIDSRDSRFQGVTELEAVTHDGETWVAAGGADSGVSLFRLLPSGRLVQVAQIADGTEWSLDGLAALGLAADDAGLLHIATAGLRDAGLSHFTFAPLTLLDGAAGNDRLTGSAGADLLRDGAGADTLTGGAGADIFVFAGDGQTETVTDFDPSEDRLDLSGWAFFRGPDQLLIETRGDGAEIMFEGPAGTERLILHSASGAPLDPEALRAALLPGPDRIMPADLDAGLSALPVDQWLDGTPKADRITGAGGGDTIQGLAGSDLLDGGDGADSLVGGLGFDTLLGGAGDDTLRGLDGRDSLVGGAGHDLLEANNGNDTLSGAGGDDTLSGGFGADFLQGGDGDDNLAGSSGPDRLEGGPGADILRGNAGPDALFGGDGDDRLEGGINHDRLEGGDGNDLLLGGNGFDTLLGGPGDDSLFGNAGHDWLEGGGGADLLDGGIGADTFVFRGGDVRIAQFQGNIDTLLFDTELLERDAAGTQDILARAETVGEDLLFDFGADRRLTVLGMSDGLQIEDAIGFL